MAISAIPKVSSQAHDDLENDELDLMASLPIPPEQFYSASAPIPRSSSQKHALRPRQNAIVQQNTLKRSYTEATGDIIPTSAKKAKLDLKKANTAISTSKKDARDEACRHWIYRHRHIFSPLLPTVKSYITTLEQDRSLQDTETSYVPFHELDEQPSLIVGGVMKDYQLQGLSFLVWMYRNGMNCILGDEMGLGKTLQTLSLFAYIKENVSGRHDPHLVVCPLTVLSSWQNEAKRWLPSMRTVRFHGSANERLRLKDTHKDGDFDILITTYECFVAEDSWFKSRRWTYCVLDEGHKIKNSETNMALKVQGIGSLQRLVLTGTPVQNNLVELWGLLHWLYPHIFTATTELLFHESFDLSRGSYAIPFMGACQKLLATVMLRRTKDVVEADVPPKEELTVFIPLSEAQRFWTYRLLTRMDTIELKQIFTDKAALDNGRREVMTHLENQVTHSHTSEGELKRAHWMKLMNLLTQLRKVCDHPYMLPNAEPEPYTLGEHVVASSSKLIAIDKLLADLLPKGERVLIFTQWTSMLDLLEDFVCLRNIPYARLDGSTTRPRRTLDIKLFQMDKSPYQVYLLSTKAANLGINLTKASTVIMVDSDWNPQNDLQAIGRAHRIGQKNVVKVYRLICRGSVEDQMLDRIRRKLFLSVKLMSSGNSSASEDPSLGSKALLSILRNGSSALDSSANGMNLEKFLSSSITDIIETSRSRESARVAMMKQELDATEESNPELILSAEEEQRQLLSGVAQVQSRLFEGRVVEKQSSNNLKQIAAEWKDLQKRTRVSNQTVNIRGMLFVIDKAPQEEIPKPAPVKQKRPPMESEDWCIHCREGGDLACCSYCPRVFHPACRGYTKREVEKSPFLACSQHSCWDCHRSTTDSGNMLFRCQTCPRAFCEDCMPDDLVPVGEIIPEFLLLNYPAKANAYFIRCHHCQVLEKEDPIWAKEWELEINKAKKLLEMRERDS